MNLAEGRAGRQAWAGLALPKPEPPVDPNVREVTEQLQRALGLKVRIEDKNGRGRVILSYSKLEEFDALLERLAGK